MYLHAICYIYISKLKTITVQNLVQFLIQADNITRFKKKKKYMTKKLIQVTLNSLMKLNSLFKLKLYIGNL